MAKSEQTNLNERLRDARGKKLDWVEVADAIGAFKNSRQSREIYTTREEFWAAMAEFTGHSRNILQRMVTTLVHIRRIEKEDQKFIKNALGEKKWADGALLDALTHFPKAEIFARIHRLDAAEAWHLLKRMQAEKFSVVLMKDILKDLTNSGPRVQHFTVLGKNRVDLQQRFAAIDEHKHELYSSDDVSIYFQRYRFPLVSADAVAIKCGKDGAIEFIDGIQLIGNISKKTDEGFKDLLSSIAFKTSFFRHVWLFLADTKDTDIDPFNSPTDRLTNALGQLGISRIGIVAYHDDGNIKIIARPKGDEKPDRYQSALTEVMRQGVPDFGAD